MTNQQQHPLAYDVDGDPLDVPDGAVAWRVRRGGGRRGRPRIVFDPDTGLQLEIPIGSTIDDLIEHGCAPDRYRLEAVDETGRIIPGIVAVIEVPETPDDANSDGEKERKEDKGKDKASHLATVVHDLIQLVHQAMQANCQTMTAMASAFGHVRPVEAAPVVVAQPAVASEASGMRPDQILQTLVSGAKVIADAWQTGTKSAGVVDPTGGVP